MLLPLPLSTLLTAGEAEAHSGSVRERLQRGVYNKPWEGGREGGRRLDVCVTLLPPSLAPGPGDCQGQADGYGGTGREGADAGPDQTVVHRNQVRMVSTHLQDYTCTTTAVTLHMCMLKFSLVSMACAVGMPRGSSQSTLMWRKGGQKPSSRRERRWWVLKL